MAGVAVVTDSAGDLTPELAERYGVVVVPLTIRFGDEEFLDRIELTPEDFWRRCKEADALPETAAPSPGAFRSAFEEVADAGADAVLCVTLSAGVSATYQSAISAAEALAPHLRVEVVDTRAMSMGEGLVATDAAEAAAAGASLDELRVRVADAIARTRLYGVVDTLEHLQRGGRIGSAQALVGSLLSIKPVIQIRDGVVTQESRQRTRSRSLEHVANKVHADAPLSRLGIANGAAADIGDLLALLDDIEVATPVITTDLGPVVGTHAGPGTIGVCYQVAPRPADG